MKKTTTIESSFARLGTTVSGRLHKFVRGAVKFTTMLLLTPLIFGFALWFWMLLDILHGGFRFITTRAILDDWKSGITFRR